MKTLSRLLFLPLLLFATSCARQAAEQPICPRVFVALPFDEQTLVADAKGGEHTLSFVKVEVLCQKDKQGTILLKLSFALMLDKPLITEKKKQILLLPLFAALTEDGKTLSLRRSQSLPARFDEQGRTQTSWLLALPRALLTKPESVATSTLYLGFEGERVLLENLRPSKQNPK